MSTTTKNDTAAALEAARAERESATAKVTEARQERDSASAKATAILEGADAKKGAPYAAAEAAHTLAVAAVANAEAKAAEAEVEVQRATAEHIAQELSTVNPDAHRANISAARKKITEAIEAVSQVYVDRSALIADAKRQARTAGLVEGKCDPFAPVYVGKVGNYGSGTEVLFLNGEQVWEGPHPASIAKAVGRAATSAGIELRLDVAKAERVSK